MHQDGASKAIDVKNGTENGFGPQVMLLTLLDDSERPICSEIAALSTSYEQTAKASLKAFSHNNDQSAARIDPMLKLRAPNQEGRTVWLGLGSTIRSPAQWRRVLSSVQHQTPEIGVLLRERMDNFSLEDRRPVISICVPGYITGSIEDSLPTGSSRRRFTSPATYQQCLRLAYKTAIEGHLPVISAQLASLSDQDLAPYLKLDICRRFHIPTNEPDLWLELTPRTYKDHIMACTSIGIYSPLLVVRVRAGLADPSCNVRLQKKQEVVTYILLIFSIVMCSLALY